MRVVGRIWAGLLGGGCFHRDIWLNCIGRPDLKEYRINISKRFLDEKSAPNGLICQSLVGAFIHNVWLSTCCER